jgi:O-antigen chain-terminating methyltransferase
MIDKSNQDALLEQYARLPESYQPVWGVDESRGLARRECDDRVAVMLPLIESLPANRPFRILDVGCAQGYFSFALKQRFSELGRDVEIVGVDYLIDNVEFCRLVAEYHQLDVRFIHDHFDGAFFERHDLGQFDIVLALNVLHHIRALDGEVAACAALQAIQHHSRVLVCEIAQSKEALDWVGSSWHASDDELLHGYPFRRKLAEFSTHLTDVKRPLYACSESLAWVAGRWFAFSQTLDRSHGGVSDAFAGQRRFLLGDGIIVKSYRGDGRYGEFNREELKFEREALTELASEAERYPALLADEDDGERLWLVRETLPGQLLSDRLCSDETLDAEDIVLELLQELARLETSGFFHSDIRCWNALWRDGQVRMIDFGALRKEATPLHRVALSAVLLEIAERKIRHAEPFYKSLQPLDSYPLTWRPLVQFLIEKPQKEFSYAVAVSVFELRHASSQVIVGDTQNYPSSDILTALNDEHCSTFVDLSTHAEESLLNYERAARHAEALAAELAKVTANIASERQAVKNAATEADTYSNSLAHELDLARRRASVSEEYAASLSARLDEMQKEQEATRELLQSETQRLATESHGYDQQAKQLEEQAQRFHSESLVLKAEIQRLEAALAALRQRFRALKIIWPRSTKD